MQLVTYNIQYGLGKEADTIWRALLRQCGAPTSLPQEVDRHRQRSGCVDSPAVLAAHLPEHHWVYGANRDVDASFRDPVVSSRNHLLPKYGTLVQHSMQRGALEVVIVTDRAGPLRIYSIHLSHLSPATRLQVATLLL